MYLKKRINKSIILLSTVFTLSLSTTNPVSAMESEVYIDNQGNIIERVYEEDKITKSTGTPSFYEYTKKVANMGVKDLDKLKSLADTANKSGSKSTLYSYASFITSFYWPGVSTALSIASMLPTSTIKPYETVSYCYDRISYLYKNPQYKKARGEIQFARFWNGHSYTTPWQPYRAPKHISYVK